MYQNFRNAAKPELMGAFIALNAGIRREIKSSQEKGGMCYQV
jgi:hypothetical protein